MIYYKSFLISYETPSQQFAYAITSQKAAKEYSEKYMKKVNYFLKKILSSSAYVIKDLFTQQGKDLIIDFFNHCPDEVVSRLRSDNSLFSQADEFLKQIFKYPFLFDKYYCDILYLWNFLAQSGIKFNNKDSIKYLLHVNLTPTHLLLNWGKTKQKNLAELVNFYQYFPEPARPLYFIRLYQLTLFFSQFNVIENDSVELRRNIWNHFTGILSDKYSHKLLFNLFYDEFVIHKQSFGTFKFTNEEIRDILDQCKISAEAFYDFFSKMEKIGEFDFEYLPDSFVDSLFYAFKSNSIVVKVKFLLNAIPKFKLEHSLKFFNYFIMDHKTKNKSEVNMVDDHFKDLIADYPEKITLVVEFSEIGKYNVEELLSMLTKSREIFYKKFTKIIHYFWTIHKGCIEFFNINDYSAFVNLIEHSYLVYPLSTIQVKDLIWMVIDYFRIKYARNSYYSFNEFFLALMNTFKSSKYLLQYNIAGDYNSYDKNFVVNFFNREKLDRKEFIRMFEAISSIPDSPLCTFIWVKLVISNILTDCDRNSTNNLIEIWNGYLLDYLNKFPKEIEPAAKSKIAFLIDYILSKFAELSYSHFPSCDNLLRVFKKLELSSGEEVLYSSVRTVLQKYQELFQLMNSGRFTRNKYSDLLKYNYYFENISTILNNCNYINISNEKFDKIEKELKKIKTAISWVAKNIEFPFDLSSTFNQLKAKTDKVNITYEELENLFFEIRNLGDSIFAEGKEKFNSEIAYYFLSEESSLFQGIMKEGFFDRRIKEDPNNFSKIGTWTDSTITILKNLMKQEVDPNHVVLVIKLLSKDGFDKELKIVKNCPFGFQEINADEHTFSQILEAVKIHKIVQMWDVIGHLLAMLKINQNSADYLAIDKLFQKFDRNIIHLKLVDEYKELKKLFENITGNHLELFQIFRGSIAIITFMKDNQLHDKGGEKFNEIKNKINVGKEGYKNDLLNSAIIAHRITAPFCNENIEFRDFLNQVRNLRLSDADLNTIKKINEQRDELSILFKSATALTLDLAIDKCERIISSGVITISVNKLAKQRTTFHIRYSFNDKPNSSFFTIEEDDVLELKRQVMFWKHSEDDKKHILIVFEKFHNLIEDIMKDVFELEDLGHPLFQLRELEKLYLKLEELHDRKVHYSKELISWKQNYSDNDNTNNHYLKIISPLEFSIVILLLSQNNVQRKLILNKIANIEWSIDVLIETENIINYSEKYILNVLRVIEQLIPFKANININQIIRSQFNNNWSLIDTQEIFHSVIKLFDSIFQPIEQHQNKSAGKQYFVTTIGNESFNLVSILFKIFDNTLPSISQILFCSPKTTNHELDNFFDLVKLFVNKRFVIVNLDLLSFSLRNIAIEKLSKFHDEMITFGEIYICNSKSAEMYYPWIEKKEYTKEDLSEVSIALSAPKFTRPNVTVVSSAKTGNGKTHFINKIIHQNHIAISINDYLDVNMVIKKLSTHINQDIFFKLSYNLNLQEIDLFFFKLLVCGSCRDESGNCFTLSNTQFKIYVENPIPNLSLSEKLTTLSKQALNCDEEILHDHSYPFEISDKERYVAKFLFRHNDGTINRKCIDSVERGIIPVHFGEIGNDVDCRGLLHQYFHQNRINKKSHQRIFVNYLARRFQFFETGFYTHNLQFDSLGATFLNQMIEESIQFLRIDLRANANLQYESPIIVFDPSWAPTLLHDDFKGVNDRLKELTKDGEASLHRDEEKRWIKLLAWNFHVDTFVIEQEIANMGFVLTKEYAFKLIQIHERKLTRVPIVIEGETGVGKTFLFQFYANLMFSSFRNMYGQYYEHIIPRIHNLLCNWFHSIIVDDPGYPVLTLEQLKNKLQDKEDHIDFSLLWNLLLNLEEKQKEEVKEELVNEQVIIKEDDEEEDAPLYQKLREQITVWQSNYPMLNLHQSIKPLFEIDSVSKEQAISMIDIFKKTTYQSVFYRILIHPGVTPKELEEFLLPIIELAKKVSNSVEATKQKIEFIVFFDEVNTGSCLGTIKEIFIDRSINNIAIPEELFLVAAINPARSDKQPDNDSLTHRNHYLVYELPDSFKEFKWYFGSMPLNSLFEYITKKYDLYLSLSEFELTVGPKWQLMSMINSAHELYTNQIGANSVSQREIQRLFKVISFLKRFSERNGDLFLEMVQYECFIVAIGLVYYLRLDLDSRVTFAIVMDDALQSEVPEFANCLDKFIDNFVTRDNFEIPDGIALNRALKENIFAMVVAFECNIPLGIIGLPGSSKTLSYQILYRNLKSKNSPKEFCSYFHAIDQFIYLCSEYSTEEDISSIFIRAIQREENYRSNNIRIKCVVFIDEASLPSEKNNVMKVLHSYLDECKVSFIAIANRAFDPANQNRMMVVVRSVAELDDLIILAKGCLGICEFENDEQQCIIRGICQGFLKITSNVQLKNYFHYRDLICTFRFLAHKARDQLLKFDVNENSLLQAMEFNMNGIPRQEFDRILKLMYSCIAEEMQMFRSDPFLIPYDCLRNPLEILQESITTDTSRYPINLKPRYKMIIDGSDNNSILEYLLENIFDKAKHLMNKRIMTVSELPDDKNDIHSAEIVSAFKSAMEQPSLVILVNGKRVHGSLYDFFNQNLTVLSTIENKSYATVAIGPVTYISYVNPGFMCIVYMKESDLKKTPTPFLSRFEKFRITISDLLDNQIEKLLDNELQSLINAIAKKCNEFVNIFGQYHFCGFNQHTLETLILSHFHNNKFYKYSYLNSHARKEIEAKGSQNHFFIRSFCARLLQILPPEVFMKKVNSLENKSLYKQLYYKYQHHFHLEDLIKQLSCDNGQDNNNNNKDNNNKDNNDNNKNILDLNHDNGDVLPVPTKFQIYCRTSFKFEIAQSKILEFNSLRKKEQIDDSMKEFLQCGNKFFIVKINGSNITKEQFLLIQSTIDQYDRKVKSMNIEKFFLVLIQFSDIYRSNFPPNFLNGWDSFYIECSSSFDYSILHLISESLSNKEESNFSLIEEKIQDLFIKEDIKSTVLRKFCHGLNFDYKQQQYEQAFAHCPDELKDVKEFYRRDKQAIVHFTSLEKIFTDHTIILELITKEFFTKKITRSNMQNLLDNISNQLINVSGVGYAALVAHEIRAEFTSFILSFLYFLVNDFNLYSLINLLNNNVPPQLFELLFRILAREYKKSVQYHKCTRYSINFNAETIYKIPKFRRIDSHFTAAFSKYKADKKNQDLSAEDFQTHILSNKKSPIYQLVNYLQDHKEESKEFSQMYAYDFLMKNCQASYNDIPSKSTCEFLVNWIFTGTINTADVIQIYHKTRNFDKELRDLYFGSRCYIELNREIDKEILIKTEKMSPIEFRNHYYSNLFDGLWEFLRNLNDNPQDEDHFNLKLKNWSNAYKQILNYFPPIIAEFNEVKKLSQITGMSVLYLYLSSINETSLEKNLNFLSSTLKQSENHEWKYSIFSLLKWISDLNIEDNHCSILMKEIIIWYFRIDNNNNNDHEKYTVLYSILNNTSPFNKKLHLEDHLKFYLFKTLKNENVMNETTLEELNKGLVLVEKTANKDIYVPSYFTSRESANPIFTQPLADYYFKYKLENIKFSKNTNELQKLIWRTAESFNKFDSAVIEKNNLMKRIQFTIDRFHFLRSLTNIIITEYKDKKLEGFSHTFVTKIHEEYFKFFGNYLLPDVNYKMLFFEELITQLGVQQVVSIFQLNTIQNITANWANEIIEQLRPKPNFHPEHLLSFMCSMQIPDQTDFQAFPHLYPIYIPFARKVEEGVIHNNCQIITEFLHSHNISLNECKMLYMLVIYHNYFSTNSLEKLTPLLHHMENNEFPRLICTPLEQSAFKAFIKPQEYMFQYNSNEESEISNLFLPSATCKNEYWEIRHILVNMLSVCMAIGPNCHLYTHIFTPIQIKGTHGFGSTRCDSIIGRDVHYDCGCILDEKGELLIGSNPDNARHLTSITSYVAFFQCYGAFILNCLFDNHCVVNLLDPILAVHAVKDNDAYARIHHASDYDKLVTFCFGRVKAGYQHLEIGSKSEPFNKEKISLLFNRLIERTYFLSTPPHLDPRFKSKFISIEEQFQAQDLFKEIFSFTIDKFDSYERDCGVYQEQKELLFDIIHYRKQIPFSHSHLKAELLNVVNLDKDPPKYAILKEFLTHYPSFSYYDATQKVVPILKLFDWLHNVFNAEVITNSLGIDLHFVLFKYKDVRPHNIYLRAEKLVNEGIEAFNKYHNLVNGQLFLGACDRENQFDSISLETSLYDLVNMESKTDNKLYEVIKAILTPRNMFLHNCNMKKEGIVFSHRISVQQLLINDNCLNLSKLSYDSLLYFAFSYATVISRDGSLSFDLDQLQEYVINWFIKGHCLIDFSHLLDQTFYLSIVKEEEEKEEGIEVQEGFNEPIPSHLIDQIEFQLKRNQFPHEEFLKAIHTLENLTCLLDEFDPSLTLNHFLVDNNNSQLLSKLASIDEISLKYFLEVYKLIKKHQEGDSFNQFTNLPLILKNRMNDVIEISTNAVIDELFEEKANEKILEYITDTFSLIKENLDTLEDQYTLSFKETMELKMSENDLIQALPDELLCSHLYDFILILLQHRTKHITAQLNDNRKWFELDENIIDGHLSTPTHFDIDEEELLSDVEMEDDKNIYLTTDEEEKRITDFDYHSETHPYGGFSYYTDIPNSDDDSADESDDEKKDNDIDSDDNSFINGEEDEVKYESDDDRDKNNEISSNQDDIPGNSVDVDEEIQVIENNNNDDNDSETRIAISQLLREEKVITVSWFEIDHPSLSFEPSIMTNEDKAMVEIFFKDKSWNLKSTLIRSNVIGVINRWKSKDESIVACNDWGEIVETDRFPYTSARGVTLDQICNLSVLIFSGDQKEEMILKLKISGTNIKSIRHILHYNYHHSFPLLFHNHIYLHDAILLENLKLQSINQITCYSKEDIHFFHLQTNIDSLVCNNQITFRSICRNVYWSLNHSLPLSFNQYEEKDSISSSLDRPLILQSGGKETLYNINLFVNFRINPTDSSPSFSVYLPKKISLSLLKKFLSMDEISLTREKILMTDENFFFDERSVELTISKQLRSTLTIISSNGEVKPHPLSFTPTSKLFNLLQHLPIQEYFILINSMLIKKIDFSLYPFSENISLIERDSPLDMITFIIHSNKSSPFPISFYQPDSPTNISLPSLLVEYSSEDNSEKIKISFVFSSSTAEYRNKHGVIQSLYRYLSHHNLIKENQYLVYDNRIAFQSHFLCLNHMPSLLDLTIEDFSDDFVPVEFHLNLSKLIEDRSIKCQVKKNSSPLLFLTSLSSLFHINKDYFDLLDEDSLETFNDEHTPDRYSKAMIALSDQVVCNFIKFEFKKREILLPIFASFDETSILAAINLTSLHFGVNQFDDSIIVKDINGIEYSLDLLLSDLEINYTKLFLLDTQKKIRKFNSNNDKRKLEIKEEKNKNKKFIIVNNKKNNNEFEFIFYSIKFQPIFISIKNISFNISFNENKEKKGKYLMKRIFPAQLPFYNHPSDPDHLLFSFDDNEHSFKYNFLLF